MSDYPTISDHGLIGDLQTAALIARDGTIDWFCGPRFDSPSLFGALLDSERGGHLRTRPVGGAFDTKQLYLPETAVLITRFLTETGVGELVDFMLIAGEQASDQRRLVRMLRCVRGTMTFEVEVAPAFNYGRSSHEVTVFDDGAVFRAGDSSVTVSAVREPGDPRVRTSATREGGAVSVSLTLNAGEVRGLLLETNSPEPPRAISTVEIEDYFHETVQFWRDWSAQSTYRGRWREELLRSAITLKLMTYAPSGGLVAAPTAALPEQIGGERNWDYRYTWVRDASFSVQALLGMGFADEAAKFGLWLRRRVQEQAGTGEGPLDIMYRVDGSSELTEETLDHWEGYRGSAPVRIGNGAASQLQLDIYGEALDSVYHLDQAGMKIGHLGWLAICDLLDWLVDNWDQPEEGIWETRGGRKAFTYGRLMTWVAFDRAIRLAAQYGRPAATERWTAARDAVYEQIMTQGWDPQRQAFVQQYGEPVLDASLLRMAQVGFIAPQDPLWLSTLQAMDEELVTDSLVYRYDPAASPDGLRGSEGTFSLCSFAYVDALARAGRLDDARLTFEKMLTYANPLGLFSEEIAPTGEQIGNFPQAFTHLALIEAGLTLDAQLDRAASRARSSTPGTARASFFLDD
ncbi:Glucoamylase (glucan-1,4-alpha-glucosidase), GH15 family [Frankineae bacterium MT45]|nr:Glucoamylase (glucan-1,4-alpha-glucosidase), GH15 family [Frankineae bacterium MT45]